MKSSSKRRRSEREGELSCPPWRFSPLRFDCADEELGSVCVWSGVGHGQSSGPRVHQVEVLILKLVAVDGFPTGSVVVGEITSLRLRQHGSELRR